MLVLACHAEDDTMLVLACHAGDDTMLVLACHAGDDTMQALAHILEPLALLPPHQGSGCVCFFKGGVNQRIIPETIAKVHVQ